MSWSEFISFVVLVEVMAVMGILAWAAPTIIDGIIKARRRNSFSRELLKLFEKSPLDRKKIEILAKEYFLNSKDIQLAVRRAFKESLTAEKPSKEKSDYFQGLYQDYERDEPFEGLPPDVRLHLERVRETLGEKNDHMLQPLASQLQSLNDENIRKNKKMLWVSVASLIIGIASFSFAAYVYYKPILNKNSIETHDSKHNKSIQGTSLRSAPDASRYASKGINSI